MAFEFIKSKSLNIVYVARDGVLLGKIEKAEGWTVRGRPTFWKAYKGSVYLGREATRKAAAELIARG